MMTVRSLAAGVEAAGGKLGRFLAEAGICASQLDDVHARISLPDYSRARRAALSTSGDPALGLHMGGPPSIAAFDFLGLLAEHSSCLREALHVAVRYAPLIVAGEQLTLHGTRDAVTVRCLNLCGDAPEVRLSAEFSVSSIVYLVRRFAGGDTAPRVFFAYEPPAHRDEYTRLFRGREHFSQPFTGVEIDRRWLERAHAYRSPELHSLLRRRGEHLLASIQHDAPASDRVRRWLSSQSLQTRPTMEMVARALGMSARSLRRKLQIEDSHYEDLAREARMQRAESMLTGSTESVQEIAYAMGFATPAAFSRAFRDWTGKSPSAHRAGR